MALFLIFLFWTASVFSELLLSHEYIVVVKQSILYLMGLLIPSLIFTGISGTIKAKQVTSSVATLKKHRMPIIALNGLAVLLPSATYLFHKASLGQFDGYFYLIQSIELIAGMINMLLIARNIRDGLSLSGRRLPFYSWNRL